MQGIFEQNLSLYKCFPSLFLLWLCFTIHLLLSSNPARESGERCELSGRAWGESPAEIEFRAFKMRNMTLVELSYDLLKYNTIGLQIQYNSQYIYSCRSFSDVILNGDAISIMFRCRVCVHTKMWFPVIKLTSKILLTTLTCCFRDKTAKFFLRFFHCRSLRASTRTSFPESLLIGSRLTEALNSYEWKHQWWTHT